jgi:uncharacterized membrane protein YgdD (TMEM256/DUF423 family)
MNRVSTILAGLFGAVGVAAAAAASHGGYANLAIGANFLLLHAPALIALTLLPPGRLAIVNVALLVMGVAFFAGDLASRDLLGHALFPMAAPLGGLGMILGWGLVALRGAAMRKSP